MFKSLLNVFHRSLIRNKGFAIINIVGLSLGISCSLFISVYTSNELSYEKHFKDYGRIYRVALERIYPDRVKKFASSPVLLAPTLKEQISSVEVSTRLHRLFFQNEVRIEIKDQSFNETRFLFADSNFFKVFNYAFLHGDPGTSLNHPSSIVLTESTAKRYFGKSNVVGEFLKADTALLQVTGVIADPPVTSHIQFDLLGSIELLEHIKYDVSTNNWTRAWVYTYIKLKSDQSAESLNARIQEAVNRASEASIALSLGTNFKSEGHKFNYFLQAIDKIHLHSDLEAEVTPSSSIAYIYSLIAVAFVILLITLINYVNLTISKFGEKAKEVGIRKTLGADDRSIRFQIFGESILMCLVSMAVSCIVVVAAWSSFLEIVDKNIPFSSVFSFRFLGFILLFLAILSVAAGVYPAFIFGRLQTSKILKNEFSTGKKNIMIRNILMITQFSIAIVMITSSLGILQQLRYIRSKDLGFSTDGVIIIKQTQTLGNRYMTFVNQVKKLSTVKYAGGGAATAAPGSFLGGAVFESVVHSDAQDVRANTNIFDKEFFETLDFKLIDGRSFSDEFNDSSSVILNASAVKAFDLKEPIGAKIRLLNNSEDNNELTVVGVVADYHFFSLHSSISPLVIFRSQQGSALQIVAVKIEPGQTMQAMKNINDIWKTLSSNPFNYSFLENDIAELYKSDLSTTRIFNIFTFLAIALSSIGLMGLTSYLAQQRLREMAIRRVLGAANAHIAFVFSKPFVWMTIYSTFSGFIISYWLMEEWLRSFAYREPWSVQSYVVSATVAFVILFLSLGIQLVRLSRLNTVKLLKEN